VGTSGNFSLVLSREPLRLLITASGRDKGRLGPGDFVVVDAAGLPVRPDMPKPSAETLLHVVAAQELGIGAVLHTHSVWATLLSDLYFPAGVVWSGYEMLKGLAGVATHDTTLRLPILDNTQNISALAGTLTELLRQNSHDLHWGFLLRRHGLYTWGRDLAEARRHLEVLEFLLEVTSRRLCLPSAPSEGAVHGHAPSPRHG
jgi:methylthioribulose-1-phosphate dehydratase